MLLESQVQIQDKTICISIHTNNLEKCRDTSLLAPVTDKIVG